MKALKRGSDALLLVAIAFLVVALLGPAWAYVVAAVCFAGSVAVTLLRRRPRPRRTGQT